MRVEFINFIELSITICESSKMYLLAEMHRNVLKQFKKYDLNEFKSILQYNLDDSINTVYYYSLSSLNHKLNELTNNL